MTTRHCAPPSPCPGGLVHHNEWSAWPDRRARGGFRLGWTRVAAVLALAVTTSLATAETAPDPSQLLEAALAAQVPTNPQLARVHVTVRTPQRGGGSKAWDVLALRQRGDDGPRSAVVIELPANVRGAAMLTAPHPEKQGLGLWLFAPEERRTVEYSPLEADRKFLMTDLSFEDLAMARRDIKPPTLLGKTQENGRAAWQVEAQPAVDRYFSRIVTTIDQETHLPLKREYYDRGKKLWRVITYRNEVVSGHPTVMEIALNDVQSRAESRWLIRKVAYLDDPVDPRLLQEVGLGKLIADPMWERVGPPPVADAETK